MVPKTPLEVYQMLPEMKIELIHGKITWGSYPIEPHTEFEKEIQYVIDKYMSEATPNVILLAAYLNECLKAYNKATEPGFKEE